MTFKEAKCPECGGALQIPDNLEKVICMYCGSEITAAMAVRAAELQAEEDSADPDKFDDYLRIATDRLPGMLLNTEHAFENFKKDKYPGAFRDFCERNDYVMEAIDKGYQLSKDKTEYLRGISSDFVKKVDENLQQIGRKKAIESKLVDYNFIMATYVTPSLLEYGTSSTAALADEILASWKIQFPKTNLGKAGFEEINNGFRKKLCYITTAVCESFGKPDDCYELTLLRSYRDTYLQNQSEGELLIKQYYDIAPTIVKRINKLPDHKEVYLGIWKAYIEPCIRLIEENKNAKCQEVYTKMVMELKEKYK